MNVKIFDVSGKEVNCRVSDCNEGGFIHKRFTYLGQKGTMLDRAVFDSIIPDCSGDTEIYAECYNKLSQTIGTLANPKDLTDYSDARHYNLPTKEGYFTAYSLLAVYAEPTVMYAYTSTHRFAGKIHFRCDEIIFEQDLAGIEVMPGETIELEEMLIKKGERNELFKAVAERLRNNHGIKGLPTYPIGWCSWYCFGPECTTADVEKNIEMAVKSFNLKKGSRFYIQIDDGYQAFMGDFLTISDRFSDFDGLINTIRSSGCEPALWVAPFIAQKESELFQKHPDFFVQGEDGMPLSSGDCSFGGWRCEPWYMLDGTNPSVLEHLKNLFSTLRSRYGIKYFKLDANMWGALPFGKRYDRTKTYVEAYRNAMFAILEGAGKDSYVLGCNAPVWASIGVVHAMRVGGDVNREFENFKTLHQESAYRNWQNANLWLNDPDCLVTTLSGEIRVAPDGNVNIENPLVCDQEFSFHRTAVLASGGVVLSGDDLCKMDFKELSYLKKLFDAPKISALYSDNTHTVGRIKSADRDIFIFLQPENKEKVVNVSLDRPFDVYDYWTDEKVFENVSVLSVKLQPREGRAYYIFL